MKYNIESLGLNKFSQPRWLNKALKL